MVFQEPMTALDPSFTIGYQLVETYLAHERVDQGVGPRARGRDARAWSGSRTATAGSTTIPHQFSGGMRQRVVIAMALDAAAEAADRRRADHRARRHDPGPDPRPDPGLRDAARDERAADHPQPRRRQRDRRPGRGDVRRRDRRERARPHRSSPTRGTPTRRGCCAACPSLDARRPAGCRSSPAACPTCGRIRTACRFAPRCPNRVERCDEVTPPTRVDRRIDRELRCFHPTPFDALSRCSAFAG